MFFNTIAHAIAYIKTFMSSPVVDENTLEHIREYSNTLSPEDMVEILKESARNSGVEGSETVVDEMSKPEFREYVDKNFRQRMRFAL